jgi:hypothetical protein
VLFGFLFARDAREGFLFLHLAKACSDDLATRDVRRVGENAALAAHHDLRGAALARSAVAWRLVLGAWLIGSTVAAPHVYGLDKRCVSRVAQMREHQKKKSDSRSKIS